MEITFPLKILRGNYMITSIKYALLLITAFYAYFNRNPKRQITIDHSALISPADGTVLYVEKYYNEIPEVMKNKNKYTLKEFLQYFPNGCTVVGIFMSPFDVHINRSPCDGEIIYRNHIEGKYDPAYTKGGENERNIILINNSGKSIGVVQIAGMLARTIVLNKDVGSK